MSTPDLGSKHACPKCMTKYYDLHKKVIVCPKCGAEPLLAAAPKAAHSARKARTSVSRRYP